MKNLFFWSSWDRLSKLVYTILIFLFSLVVVLFCISWYRGVFQTLRWEEIVEYKTIPYIFDQIKVGIFSIPLQADNYLSFSTYFGSSIEIDVLVVLFYFLVVQFCIIFALTTVSFLNKYIFYIGLFLITAIFLFQQPVLLFSGIDYLQYLNLLPILFLGLPVVIFNFYLPNTNFTTRLLVISLALISYYYLLYYYTGNNNMIVFLTNYSSSYLVILSILFIILISFEVVYFILNVIDKSKTEGSYQNVIHFLIINFIYLANLLVHFLINNNSIKFSIYTIHPFFILILSSVLGIWGFRKRSVAFQTYLPFYPFGATIYLLLGLMCFSTLGYQIYIGNDPMVEVIEDAVLYTHIGFGLGFFLYVALYFGSYFRTDIKIASFVYTNKVYTFLTVYATGALICVTMFLFANMFPKYQFWAGHYNAIGDIYLINKEDNLAKEYYKKSLAYEFQNHKANYTLAYISLQQKDEKEALKYFKKSGIKNASPYCLANIANLEFVKNELNGIVSIKESIAKYPNNAELLSNLALYFHKINMLDSSYYYIEKALKCGNKSTILANKVAVLTYSNIYYPSEIESKDNLNLVINALANAKSKIDFTINQIDSSQILDDKYYYLYNNYSYKTLKNSSQRYINDLEKISYKDTNLYYRSDIAYLTSILKFYNGDVLNALKKLDELQLDDQGKGGYYLNMIGLLYLKLGLPDMARDVFDLAIKKDYKQAKENYIIAALESGTLPTIGDNILNTIENQDIKEVIYKIYSIKGIEQISLQNDETKALILRYRKNEFSDEQIGNIYYSISDIKVRRTVVQDLISYYYNKSNPKIIAEIIYSMKPFVENDDDKKAINDWVGQYYLMTLDSVSIVEESDKLTFSEKNMFLKDMLWVIKSIYTRSFDAIHEQKADSLLKAYPQVDYFAIALARYYQKVNPKKAYETLLNGHSFNPYSLPLLKAYILQTVEYGIPKFAESALATLKTKVSKSEFLSFKQAYEAKLKELYGN